MVPKYWSQRYRLFHKWDLGVRLDETAWYSVTPESIATHHAVRCSSIELNCETMSSIVILDAFCGVGGNAIQFAFKVDHVLAFDNRFSSLRLVRAFRTSETCTDHSSGCTQRRGVQRT